MKQIPALATLTLALLLSSCGDSSTNINGDSGGDDPYGYSSSTRTPSSSSIPTPAATAGAVVITLTYWQTTYTELTGPDPKIHFKVIAKQNGRQISSNDSKVLLDLSNTSQSWSGSNKSSPIPFASQADEVDIYAVVIEEQVFSNDDISPGQYMRYYSPFNIGRSGSTTLDYGSGKSTVRYDYEFVRQ
jgi:hypothetical protein